MGAPSRRRLAWSALAGIAPTRHLVVARLAATVSEQGLPADQRPALNLLNRHVDGLQLAGCYASAIVRTGDVPCLHVAFELEADAERLVQGLAPHAMTAPATHIAEAPPGASALPTGDAPSGAPVGGMSQGEEAREAGPRMAATESGWASIRTMPFGDDEQDRLHDRLGPPPPPRQRRRPDL